MYTRVTRYSFNGSKAEEEGAKLYEQAKPMWSGQQGFHSMQRYRIVEGPNANQQMVVVRFNSKNDMKKAREAVSKQRDQILKKLDEVGVKTEEAMELEEIT
jgi:heme-degrading monooxygenase HmoA